MEIGLLPCPLCLQPHFVGVEALRSTLVGAATAPLKCPVCGETLRGLDKLTIHLFSHIGEAGGGAAVAGARDSPRPECLKCDICNFAFADQTVLELHQTLLHQTAPDRQTGLYSYHCHLCSKKFKKRASLMVHLRVAHYGFTHQRPAEPPPADPAPEDGAVAARRPADNKQWGCDVCSKMFTTKYFLKKHKRLHTGEMPYFCSQCNKSFTFQQSYHKHMLYHSSEKPHTCPDCGRSFKELSTLQNHQRIHSGERPFGCEVCGKRFRQRVSYLVHQRIHTGAMPYRCTACGRSFRYKVSQRSHKCAATPPGDVVRVVADDDDGDGDRQGRSATTVDFGPAGPDQPSTTQNDQPDLFSMVLSPLLPEVESLCLTGSPPNDNLLGDVSLKQLFYEEK